MRQLTLKDIKEALLYEDVSTNDLACFIISDLFRLAWNKEKEGKKDIAEIYERKASALFKKLEAVGYYTTGEEVEA